MGTETVDILVIGGGIHGTGVARDAAGRGLKVMLAERDDYASATASASSKLIHGGLRYLEQMDLRLVRESLVERAGLLKTAPHLVSPLKFLLPIFDWQRRPAWVFHAGLSLYDVLSFGDGLPASGRLGKAECAQLPRLRRDHLSAVLHYHDAQTDDARLTLSVALDARARGADIANRRAVTGLIRRDNGFSATLLEQGVKRQIDARFIINTAGPFVAEVEAMTQSTTEAEDIRLVRGSHIVLPMPAPAEACAYTLQDEGERIIFVVPWRDKPFLMVGTTDVPQSGTPGSAVCSREETTYLLGAYNRYFAQGREPETEEDIVYSWSGLRTLHGDGSKSPSRLSRDVTLETRAQGTGGLLTLIGGKLTTHRATAELILDKLQALGLTMGTAWTKGVQLYGGSLWRDALLARAEAGPDSVPTKTRRRWALTYGDKIDDLYARLHSNPGSAEDIAPGVPRAELDHAREEKDALSAEDFLLRRTKLRLLLDEKGRKNVEDCFAKT